MTQTAAQSSGDQERPIAELHQDLQVLEDWSRTASSKEEREGYDSEILVLLEEINRRERAVVKQKPDGLTFRVDPAHTGHAVRMRKQPETVSELHGAIETLTVEANSLITKDPEALDEWYIRAGELMRDPLFAARQSEIKKAVEEWIRILGRAKEIIDKSRALISKETRPTKGERGRILDKYNVVIGELNSFLSQQSGSDEGAAAVTRSRISGTNYLLSGVNRTAAVIGPRKRENNRR